MGTDIHLVVEYNRDGYRGWNRRGTLWLPRDYRLFHALAGIRGDGEPLYPPRGLPKDMSSTTRGEYYPILIIDDAKPMKRPPSRGRLYMLRSEVDAASPELTRSGICIGRNGSKFLSEPDWHTPSWLTYEEIQLAMAHAELTLAERSAEFRALLAAMAELAFDVGADQVRIAFWFNN